MKISRRNLVQIGALAGLGIAASQYHLEIAQLLKQNFGLKKPKDIFNFYNDSFDSPMSLMAEADFSYFNASIGLAEQGHFHIKDDFFYSSFSISHKIVGDRVNSKRWAIGSFTKSEELMKIAIPCISSKGVSFNEFFDGTQLIGLGWDFEENLFKIYAYVKDFNKLTSNSWAELLKEHRKFESENFGLISVSFLDGKPVENKTYLPLRSSSYDFFRKKYPFADDIIHINLMNTTGRGIVPQLDLRKGNPASDHINSTGQSIVEKYAKFGLPLDTITYGNEGDYVLYFG